MASSLAVSMAIPFTKATPNRLPITTDCFFKPFSSKERFEIKASSIKEKAVTGLTATALTVSMMIPEVAEAAESGVSPSLKNFLLSILAGGVVLAAILGAIIAVSNFDPVKRS